MEQETARLVFWLSIACVLYTYAMYPLLIAGMSRLRSRKFERSASNPPSVSIVMAVRNEEDVVANRVNELGSLLSRHGANGELIVVSDGSTDGTLAMLSSMRNEYLRVISLPEKTGKAAALTEGCKAANGEILVFADVRQRWDSRALEFLVSNFARPDVGAVAGELILDNSEGVVAGIGLYWRFEKWLRRNEAIVHSTVGVSGSISAVRRHLFKPIPPGTLLDDVYWPMQVVLQGFRVAFEERANAFDTLPLSARDEFRRKVRTLSGNFQLVALLPRLLVPYLNPIWAQFVSHKLLRLVVPWALITALMSSAVSGGILYRSAFAAQLFFYALGVSAIIAGTRFRFRATSAIAAFLLLNAAAWLGFWVWVTGRAGASWKKVTYRRDSAT